jgi:hypothetical protein
MFGIRAENNLLLADGQTLSAYDALRSEGDRGTWAQICGTRQAWTVLLLPESNLACRNRIEIKREIIFIATDE